VPLKILTFNLWHDAGPWKERAALARDWIARLDPDLIGFQEVLRGAGVDLVAQLVSERGYHVDFARASAFWRDDSLAFGNAVASRWPIESRDELQLPDRGDGETRVALTVGIRAPIPGERLSFTCTHLNWKFHHGVTRERQVVALCDRVRRLRARDGFPSILVGDFNAEPGSDEIRYVKGLHSIDGRSVHFHDAWEVARDREEAGGSGNAGVTWSNRNPYARENLEPARRIDYIFVGRPMLGGSGIVDHCRVVCDQESGGVWPSDHFGLYAELRT
jgi:endonuclease/exonuclease/phosphatase family metal-dependent hydrolase